MVCWLIGLWTLLMETVDGQIEEGELVKFWTRKSIFSVSDKFWIFYADKLVFDKSDLLRVIEQNFMIFTRMIEMILMMHLIIVIIKMSGMIQMIIVIIKIIEIVQMILGHPRDHCDH